MEILTAAQMRAIEQAAIDSGEVTGLELMERAGQGVVDAIFEHWPAYESAPQSVAVLCGPGNNGGDGFVVARLLKARGWTVSVFFYGTSVQLPRDARTNYDLWVADDSVTPLTERAFRALPFTLYVDALFGTGLSRALTGDAFDVIHHMSGIHGDDYSKDTISIDAPSGLCLDSGCVLDQELSGTKRTVAARDGQPRRGPRPMDHKFAAVTVTFDSPKAGHFLANGPSICGHLVVKDIGLENWRVFQKIRDDRPAFKVTEAGATGAIRPARLQLVTRSPLVKDLRNDIFNRFDFLDMSLRKQLRHGHKFDYGHALVLTGGGGSTGAARLAARGALRIGAGLVTLGTPPSAQMEVANHITALMLKRVGGPEALIDILNDPRINTLCLGPGLGLDRARDLVPAALSADRGQKIRRAVVLDADALSVYSDAPDALFEHLHDRCVLTPHHGEFRRLFPDIADRLAAPANTGPAFSKVDATREAAARAGCKVIFKGVDTVIADQNGLCFVHSATGERAAPWLATAGSGDVLAGFLTGLLAQGGSPITAAQAAVWLHVECARFFGPGLIAEDLPEELPKVLRSLFKP